MVNAIRNWVGNGAVPPQYKICSGDFQSPSILIKFYTAQKNSNAELEKKSENFSDTFFGGVGALEQL